MNNVELLTVDGESAKSPLDMLIELGLVELPEEASKEINDEPDDDIVTENSFVKPISIDDVQVIVAENSIVDDVHLVDSTTSEPVEVILKVNKSKVTTSGYACFLHYEKEELKKIDPKGRLNMVVTYEKWKNFSEAEKEIFENIASDYKSSSLKPICVSKVTKNVTKPALKIKKNKMYCESGLTNREFVDKFEDFDLKTEKLSERNKKLSEIISGKKISILKNSLTLRERNESEAKYKDRYQRLLSLHGKCIK
eukprot:GFUD01137979.1.p1 GENE.GFUD01137979.1~~GFUD01137979.1.p1  ORF type:complete len:253 (+),score=78.14 GFUD01137979.1:41-799(+)